jgi:hypothetical protein
MSRSRSRTRESTSGPTSRGSCRARQAKYKLTISEDGKTVRMAPVEDGCGERSAIIAQVSFVRKE